MKKYVRSTTIYIVLALAILLPVWTAPFYASQKPDSQEYIQDIPDSEPKVLTVGYSQTPGICTVDAFGNLHGLMIDYLNEIAKYNNCLLYTSLSSILFRKIYVEKVRPLGEK